MPDVYESLLNQLVQRVNDHQKLTSAPFICAITGPIAVGKSFFAQQLLSLLHRPFPKALCLNTDGFIFSSAELEARHLMKKKGHPETYDLDIFRSCLLSLKQKKMTRAPLYSAELYDRDVSKYYSISPDSPLIILEGLNIYHSNDCAELTQYIDTVIYLDAQEKDLWIWYQERRIYGLIQYKRNSLVSPYWEKFKQYSEEEYAADIQETWLTINLPNIRQHIAPHKMRADIIIEKNSDHSLAEVK